MKKAIIAIFALGLLIFSAPADSVQVTVAKDTNTAGHPILPPV
jgi:hypothetical protein